MDVGSPRVAGLPGHAARRSRASRRFRTHGCKLLALPAALFLLGGCTSMAQPHAFNSPAYAAEPPIFLDGRPRLIEPDKVDRYACHTGMPLDCRCVGRLAASCECSCPPLVP